MPRFALIFVVLLSLTSFACGNTGAGATFPPDATSGQGDGGDSGLSPDGHCLICGNKDGGGMPTGPLAIAPVNPVLTAVSGKPAPTQAFTATVGGETVDVAWSFNQGPIGSIGAGGFFTATGTQGGTGTVTAVYGSQNATTTLTVNLQTTDNGDPAYTSTPPDAGTGGYGGVGGNGPGAPPTATQIGTLNGTPTADATVSILYPYSGTVWPQGLLAALVQWNPAAYSFDSIYIHISESHYDFKGYFAANATPFINLPIPQGAWSAMAYSNGGEPVNVSIVFAQGTKAYGPYTETWTIAQAPLQGAIYYNSYGTALVQNSDGNDSYGVQYGAGTLSIASGATSPTLVAGVAGPEAMGGVTGPSGCRVCHTVAANGQTLVTQANSYVGGGTDYSTSVTIDLGADTTGGAGAPLATGNLTFPAVYKDGSLLLANAGGFPYTLTPTALYSLPSGNPVTGVTGLGTNLQASLPAFSPDGTLLAFNFWGGMLSGEDGGTLNGDEMSLALLDFNGTNAFSSPRVVYTPPSGNAVTYSSFFPNSDAVVFGIQGPNALGNSVQYAYTWDGATSEIWWLDVKSGMATRLDSLNGWAGATQYLPAGPNHTAAQDVILNYEPTVAPIASGGYAWVVFTSRRMYGNVAQLDPWTSDPRDYPWHTQVTDKKLWVAAVDLNAKPGTDPSHPAFYLPAQELNAGNARGYWALAPCLAEGKSCTEGDECCGGYCEPSGDGGALVCTSTMPMCSGLYDKCTTTSNCCGASSGIQCLGGVCTQTAPK
jgi:hypothetical protein